MFVPILLFFFWLYIAYRAFSRGDLQSAMVYLVIGIALTIWRLSSAGVSLGGKKALVKQPAAMPPPPPPALPAQPLYLARQGQQEGPFTQDYVRGEIAAGRLTLNDLGWKEGLPEWVPLSSILK